MAQELNNLNLPPSAPLADAKTGAARAEWLGWFKSLASVARWAVAGALSAASLTIGTVAALGAAVINGTLNVTGVLTLGTAVAVPANGQIGAGDAAWRVVGAAGQPGIVNWTILRTVRFRKLPSGLVVMEGAVQATALSVNPIFSYPGGYQPGQLVIMLNSANNTAGFFDVNTNGDVNSISAIVNGAAYTLDAVFYADQ